MRPAWKRVETEMQRVSWLWIPIRRWRQHATSGGMSQTAAALSSSPTETEALSADEVAEHAPPSVLAHLLRTVRYHIAQATDVMRQVANQTSDGEWEEQATHLRRIAAFVEDRVIALDLGQRSFLLPDQFQRFSTLLRQRRESALLSGIELSKRAGLSLRTIKNIESGQVSPSRETVLRLLAVEELALTWKDVLDDPTQPSASSPATDTNYNCYIPPGYDSMRMVQQLVRILNGPGGHIEQTNAYLEHRSALAYVSMCHDVEYVTAYRAKYPLDSLARRVMTEGGNSPLKVIALGAGDGYLEVRLVQHLLSMRAKPDIELLLFDISQPLLTAAYQHAIDTFGEQSAVHTLLVHGNFHDLAQYPQVSYTPAKGRRRRLYTMLGYTLANLDSEPRFFEHSLAHCQAGDMLLLDFQQRPSPIGGSEDEIRRQDPAFHHPFKKVHADWLGTPFSAHCRDYVSHEFSLQLVTQCLIPGSYALDAVATVRTKNQTERRFSMFRFKRYDEALLTESLARFGWEKLVALPIGESERAPVAMLLVKR
jgi:transcriptional regulator with XRE-family HTH domain